MAQITTILSEFSSHGNVSQLICIYDDITLQVEKLAIATKGSIRPAFRAELYESDGRLRETKEGNRDSDLDKTSLNMKKIVKRDKEMIVPDFRVRFNNTWNRENRAISRR